MAVDDGVSGDGDNVVALAGQAGGWSPEWPGQRAPFADGNTAALTHGSRSPRRISEVAAQFERALMESPLTPGYLRGGQFQRAIVAWSRAEAQCELLYQYLDEVGVEDALAEMTESTEDEDRPAMGEMRRKMRQRRTLPALDALNRAESRAANLRARLGLDPRSYMEMAKDVSLARRAGEHDPLVKMGKAGAEIIRRRQVPAAAAEDPA